MPDLSTLMLASFSTSSLALDQVGGKGANLARLARAGFPVPGGFILSTQAYRAYVAFNQLDALIQSALTGLVADDPHSLESASAQIRAGFEQGKIPDGIAAEIKAAYQALGAAAVAVRSSATAEDLPDLSFAGQQDTYLNQVGAEQVLQAVVNCWGSLWTARAIGYRARNQIDHHSTALAVVVQEMVQSEAAGVMFTANPLSGLLSETVIDATFGLGEALVSGLVEPDHFVVDSSSGAVRQQSLGTKKVLTQSLPGGGVQTVAGSGLPTQTLSAEELRQLVEMGQRIQQEYGAPQDIEWARADGRLYILQSRPITSLFPIPLTSFDPLVIWLSFGAVQGLLSPLTPLGRDSICQIIGGAGKMFNMEINPDRQTVFGIAGERLWVKMSDVIRHPIGSRIFQGLFNFIEPSACKIIAPITQEARLGAGKGRLTLRWFYRLAYFFIPVILRTLRVMIEPHKARDRFDAIIDAYLHSAQIPKSEDRFEQLSNIISYIKDRVRTVFPHMLPRFIPIFAPSMASLNLLKHLARNDSLVLEVTRGVPNNVTTQMDLELWRTAQSIRQDATSVAVFLKNDATSLAQEYLNQLLPAPAQSALAQFLQLYGMRGVGEIDFGRPRWREDPTPVIQTLQSYLKIDPRMGPDVIFAQGEAAALRAVEQLAADVRRQPGGWMKEKIVRGAARRIRLLIGARESPKFLAVRVMSIGRQALLEVGARFAAAGEIDQAQDLVFLNLNELESLSRRETRDWKSLITARKQVYQRELRRRQVPRVLVSDGRAFYEGVGAASDSANVLNGSPVSPGLAEGVVRIVLDPRSAHLEPGEILVCPGTDPAWTPLFMAAGGLVTEVGGVMTHGSVVAREYGIPAVVGVHQATSRLKTGQRIRLDGSTGKIEILSLK